MLNKKIRILAIFTIAVLVLASITSLDPTSDSRENELIKNKFSREPIKEGTRSSTEWPMHLGSLSHLGFTSSSVPSSNSILWNNTTGSGDGYGSPIIADGKVFVGSADGHLYCFDLYSGERLWRTFLSNFDFGICSTPAYANNHVIIFSSGDDNLYRLRASDGGIDWTFDPPGSGQYGGSSPAIYNGRVYIGSGNKNLYCINENTGNLIWTFTTGTAPILDYGIQSSPAVANGRVFFGSCDTYLYCVNESQPTSTAEYFWRTNLFDAVFGSAAVANSRVYVGSGYYSYMQGTGSHTLFCLDELTGAVIWSYQTGSDIISSPSVAYGNVYFTSTDGELYCVDAGGAISPPTLHWSETVGDTWSSPAVSDDKVVVGSRGTNTIYCFNANTGSLVWNYDAGDDIYSSPAIADGKVVVSVRGFPESIYCFGGGAPPPPPPTNLQAQLTGGGSNVMLTWSASADDGSGDDDVTGYSVYKSTTGVNGIYEYTAWIAADNSPSYSWTDTGSGDGDTNDYFYIVRAKDGLDSEEQNTNKVGKVVYDLTLGWDLISIPLEQVDTSRAIVLQTLGTDLTALQGYHTGTSTPWLHWHRDKPSEFNDVIDIDHKEGYFLDLKNSDSLVAAGKVPKSNQISLEKGWNLIGFPSLETLSRNSALSSITGSFDRVESYNAGAIEVLGPSDPMIPGKGYWIHTTENCVWEI